ncbi:cytochrome P450 2J6-like [Pholidichthys leucotaenia]
MEQAVSAAIFVSAAIPVYELSPTSASPLLSEVNSSCATTLEIRASSSIPVQRVVSFSMAATRLQSSTLATVSPLLQRAPAAASLWSSSCPIIFTTPVLLFIRCSPDLLIVCCPINFLVPELLINCPISFTASDHFTCCCASDCLICCSASVSRADYFKNRRPAGFPPGPPGLPVLGNLFSLDFSKAHESITQSHYNSSPSGASVEPTVGAALEMLAAASLDAILNHRLSGKRVVFSNGHIWKQQRRFALSTLKYFGFGKKSLEPVILEEFSHCAKYFRDYKGEPFNPHITINSAVSNIICFLVFGHRFEYRDQKFVRLLKLFDSAFHLQGSVWVHIYNLFPLLMSYLPSPAQTILQNWKEVKEFIRIDLNEHKKTWNPSDSRDYIDCYLNEIKMSKDQSDSTFVEENLIMCVLDLFVGGSETTSTTLRWAFLYMAKYPAIQEKVQAEIDREIGQSRPPSMEDRAKLPYTDAVIHEIQRIGNILPLSLPHITNREVQLGGYTLPKGVIVIPNLNSALFDHKEWEKPHTFNPKHFLIEEGRFVKRAAFVPFSAGKRLCLGENLARMELFLFFTSFMQHFTFSMPAGVKPDLGYRYGMTLAPKDYELCITPRQ